jgi:hypothetical protein
MQQKEWEARYQWMRRATTGRNVLGWIALGFMAGFGYFWYSIWAIVFAPPSLFSPQGIVAAMISVVYTVVLPLFWSMIIPNSPAGRLLQKQTWALPGQIVILILACLLSGVAIRAFQGWLSQPQIDPGLYYPALLAMTTAAIFVPALCWAATTPEQFIALYESARIAKQLEQQAQLEDLKFKALHARFCAVVNADMRELTIEQFGQVCEEMTSILATGARKEAQRYHALARTFNSIYGIELAGSSDPKGEDKAILEQYQHVNRLLSNAGDQHAYVESRALDAIDVTPRASPRDAALPQATHVDTRLQSSESRAAASDNGSQRPTVSDPVARRIAAELPRIFTAQNLADLVQQDKRTAQRTIATWLGEGMIEQVQLGRYSLTERERH